MGERVGEIAGEFCMGGRVGEILVGGVSGRV